MLYLTFAIQIFSALGIVLTLNALGSPILYLMTLLNFTVYNDIGFVFY